MTDLRSTCQAALHGQWDSIIGLPQTSWFDVKSAISALDQTGPRAELCKDVAAMADAQGGLLLIGVRTEMVDGIMTFHLSQINHEAPGPAFVADGDWPTPTLEEVDELISDMSAHLVQLRAARAQIADLIARRFGPTASAPGRTGCASVGGIVGALAGRRLARPRGTWWGAGPLLLCALALQPLILVPVLFAGPGLAWQIIIGVCVTVRIAGATAHGSTPVPQRPRCRSARLRNRYRPVDGRRGDRHNRGIPRTVPLPRPAPSGHADTR